MLCNGVAMFAKGNLLAPPQKKDALEQCISFQIMSILGSYVSFQGCKTNQSTRSHRILDFLWFSCRYKYAVAVHGWYRGCLPPFWANSSSEISRLKTVWCFRTWSNKAIFFAARSNPMIGSCFFPPFFFIAISKSTFNICSGIEIYVQRLKIFTKHIQSW